MIGKDCQHHRTWARDRDGKPENVHLVRSVRRHVRILSSWTFGMHDRSMVTGAAPRVRPSVSRAPWGRSRPPGSLAIREPARSRTASTPGRAKRRGQAERDAPDGGLPRCGVHPTGMTGAGRRPARTVGARSDDRMNVVLVWLVALAAQASTVPADSSFGSSRWRLRHRLSRQ